MRTEYERTFVGLAKNNIKYKLRYRGVAVWEIYTIGGTNVNLFWSSVRDNSV